MDFRNLLQSMSSLSEGETKETPKGRVHKGEYGTSHGKEDVRDQYGHKVGKIDKDAGSKKEAPKKGRGRPKKGADDSGEVKSYDTKSLGDVFGGGKKPKKEVGKVSKKHSLKEYIEELETTIVNEGEQSVEEAVRIAYRDPTGKTGMPGLQGNTVRYKSASQVAGHKAANPDSDWIHNPQTQAHRNAAAAAVKDARAKGITPGSNQGIGIHKGVDEDMNTQQPVQIKPASQTNTQVIQQGNKTLGTVNNPQLAQQIKQSIGKGEMSLNPNDQEMAEDGGEKWIQKAIKHPGALTKKAKAAGQSTQAFAKAHAHDKGTTGKQARLAQTLSKMHESLQANGMVLTEGQKEQMIKFFDELELGPKGYNIKPAVELKDKALATSVINKTLAHGRFRSMSGSYKDQMRDAALEHFGFTNYEESLEEGDLVPHPSKDLHTTHGMDSKPGDISVFKPSRIQATKPVEKPTPWSVDPINAATDRAVNFISGLRKPKTRLESTDEMKDVQFESWEKQLNSMLNEGITVSSSTGQQGSPDSVTISATDADAEQLMGVLRNAGIGVFGGNDKPVTGYGVVSQGEEEPTGTGTEPQMSPDVVGDGDDMLALIKKMSGIDMGGEEGSQDYEDEEGSDDTALQPADSEEGHEQSDDANDSGEESDDEEEKTDEGNAFGLEVSQKKSDDIPDSQQRIKTGGQNLPVKEEEVEEGNKYLYNVLKAKAAGKKEADLDGDGKMDKVKEGHESCNECGYPMESCECEEQVEEGFSNDAGGDAMGDTELMKLKALLSMGGDLHKMKSDQTVGNPTRVSVRESLNEWKKLSGIK